MKYIGLNSGGGEGDFLGTKSPSYEQDYWRQKYRKKGIHLYKK